MTWKPWRVRSGEKIDDEMQFHLDMLARQFQRERGMSPKEAMLEARRHFGSVALAKDAYQDQQHFAWFTGLSTDLRLAMRMLSRSPGIAVIAVLIVALGVGANTAIFSLLDQILYRLLPVREPERLVKISMRGPMFGPNGSDSMSYPMFRHLRDNNQVFESIFGRQLTQVNAGFEGQTERLWAEYVTGDFYGGLGVRAHIGRLITPHDDTVPGGHPVAVLSYSYWQARFDSDPTVIGRAMVINGGPFSIIGVSERGFEGVERYVAPQVHIPAMMKRNPVDPQSRWMTVYGRLKPGLSSAQAVAGIQPIYKSALEEEARGLRLLDGDAGTRARFLKGVAVLLPAAQGETATRAGMQSTGQLLIAIVAVLLLIACANIANLLLARSASRQKEIAVRLALGGSRGRLVRQLLVESLLLSILGGLLAIGFAFMTMQWALSFSPPEIPASASAAIDGRTLLFNFLLTSLTGFLFGLAPALLATRPDVAPVLKDQASNIAGGSHDVIRRTLVVAQITLSLTLLITAGLFVRSLAKLRDADPGFRTDNLLVFNVDPKMNGYSPERIRELRARLTDELRRVPGVASVTAGKHQILGGDGWISRFVVAGSRTNGPAYVDAVEPGFFAAVGMPLLAGRDFAAQDSGATWRSAIVNETFVRNFLPDRDPLGAQLGFAIGSNPPARIEIAGVVKDAKTVWMRSNAEPQVFLAAAEDPSPSIIAVYVRASEDPKQVFGAIQSVVRRLDANLPVFGLRTMQAQIDVRIVMERFLASLSSATGMLAMLLASVGLYGVMAFMVSRRTQEIGIRMTLGADQRTVLWMVMREALILGAWGIGLGVVAALGLARLLRNLIFGMSPTDLVTFVGATILMLAVIIAAAFAPAWKAARVDPVAAMRVQ